VFDSSQLIASTNDVAGRSRKVKQREFVLAESFFRRALLLLVKAVDELDETPDRFLDRGAVFLAIIGRPQWQLSVG
jgi:hypothetical protein